MLCRRLFLVPICEPCTGIEFAHVGFGTDEKGWNELTNTSAIDKSYTINRVYAGNSKHTCVSTHAELYVYAPGHKRGFY